MKGLSVSMQNYIKAVYELSSGGDGTRICDIAAKVGVTKASACVAMKSLEKKKLVYRDANRIVFLTTEGEFQALRALDKAGIIRRFLTDVLGVSHEIAEADANEIEHFVSAETLCALCRFSNQKCAGRI